MLNIFRSPFFVIISCSVMLFGCGVKGGKQAKPEEAQLSQINCIGVLPPLSVVEGQMVPIYIPKEKSSRRGIEAMNVILNEKLGGKDNIRFVAIDQVSSLELTGGESSLTLAKMVGKSIKCDAVLESMVKRFNERVGSRYSVESPASVAFEMRLISVQTGAILWSAKFDEVQKSVMANILEWNKANTRGFTWITAEELMREGVSERFAGSPYFSPEKKMNQPDASSPEDTI